MFQSVRLMYTRPVYSAQLALHKTAERRVRMAAVGRKELAHIHRLPVHAPRDFS